MTVLSPETIKTLKKGKAEGWDKITKEEQKQAVDDLKKNGSNNRDHFIIAFWMPEKIKQAIKLSKKTK